MAKVIPLKKADYRNMFSKVADILKIDFDFHTAEAVGPFVSGKAKHTVVNTGVDVPVDLKVEDSKIWETAKDQTVAVSLALGDTTSELSLIAFYRRKIETSTTMRGVILTKIPSATVGIDLSKFDSVEALIAKQIESKSLLHIWLWNGETWETISDKDLGNFEAAGVIEFSEVELSAARSQSEVSH